jgi:membrane protein
VCVVGLGYLKSVGGTPSDALEQFGIRGVLASTINSSASFHDPGRAAVLFLGIVGVLSGARTTAATVRAIHAIAWGLPLVRWRRGGRAALVFLGAVVVGFACAGLAARARSAAGVGIGLGASALVAAVTGGIWLGASGLLPHRPGIRWTALVPGAMLVGIAFAVLQALTVNLLGPKLEHDSALYGSLGIAFVVLGWLYLVGRVLVAAPLLNVALLEHREARSAKAPAPRQPTGPAPSNQGAAARRT